MPSVPMVRAHDAGDAMFIIASGEAVVEISPSRQVVLKESDFFGEMALLEHRRHKHDVVAKTRCRLYVLDSGSLARLGRRIQSSWKAFGKWLRHGPSTMIQRSAKTANARWAPRA